MVVVCSRSSFEGFQLRVHGCVLSSDTRPKRWCIENVGVGLDETQLQATEVFDGDTVMCVPLPVPSI